MHHPDFYVAAATALPVLVIAGVIQTRFVQFFRATGPSFAMGTLVILVLVAGETASLASLEADRDTSRGRAMVCVGLGVAGFWLVGPMLAGRLLPDAGVTWKRFVSAVFAALAILFFAGYVGVRAVGIG